MTIKSMKLAGALFAALTVAAPLALSATPAEAAPHYNGQMGGGTTGGFHNNRPDSMHDRNHQPPQRVEYRSHQPRGHSHWRAGQWNWSRDHWVWTQGIWMRF